MLTVASNSSSNESSAMRDMSRTTDCAASVSSVVPSSNLPCIDIPDVSLSKWADDGSSNDISKKGGSMEKRIK